MFGDGNWTSRRTDEQETRFAAWLRERAEAPLAIVELGAGRVVPTVRRTSKMLTERPGTTLIRINPHEPDGPPGTLSLARGALAVLRRPS
jgi:hypothetical protein